MKPGGSGGPSQTPRMEKRHLPDRRRRPRGGRRAGDVAGFTPLVFVVSDKRRREVSEAILAKLRFAVAPFDSADAAAAMMLSLRPEVVVAGRLDYMKLRDKMAPANNGLPIPLVLIPDGATPEAVVEAVRAALRQSPVS